MGSMTPTTNRPVPAIVRAYLQNTLEVRRAKTLEEVDRLAREAFLLINCMTVEEAQQAIDLILAGMEAK